MIFLFKKIYYAIFNKNYNFTKTLINQYYTSKKKTGLVFSSIGSGTKYIQNEEFFYLTKKYNIIFIRDITRSWLNNVDIKLIKKNLNKRRVDFTIGYSMGGFNAIIFSTLHKVKKVIAFSPQFSIHPKISKDKTFLNYASRIKEWKYPQLKFSENTDYFLIFGDNSLEKYHGSLVPKKKNIKIIYIKNSDHEIIKKLKRTKKMYKIINKFLR
jgi:alpha-beta hydrolase superfamily lysophospholipase